MPTFKADRPSKLDGTKRGIKTPSSTAPDASLEARREAAANLYLCRTSIADIAKRLGVSTTTAAGDIKWARERWRENANSAIADRTAEELARIDNLELLALQAWLRSCEPVEVSTHRVEEAPKVEHEAAGPGGKAGKSRPASQPKVGEAGNELVAIKVTTESKRTGQVGNPAFLSQVAWCIEQRLKLMGAYKQPEGGAGGTTNVTINWGDMYVRPSREENPVKQKMQEALDKARRQAGGGELKLPPRTVPATEAPPGE